MIGVIKDEIVANDPGYFHHRTMGRPLVTLKLAATLDGQVGAVDGSSRWISSPEARDDAHKLRSANDVVVVGAGTVIADDPMLDVRLDSFDGPQPRPVIIAGLRAVPADRVILDRDPIVYHPQDGDVVDPVHVVTDLAQRGYVSALVEGGPSIAASFLRADVVDEIIWYLAAKLGGGLGIPAIGGVFESMDDIVSLHFADVERIGPDVKILATVSREP